MVDADYSTDLFAEHVDALCQRSSITLTMQGPRGKFAASDYPNDITDFNGFNQTSSAVLYIQDETSQLYESGATLYFQNVSAQCPRTTLAFVRWKYRQHIPCCCQKNKRPTDPHLGKTLDHLVASTPIVVVPRQPTLWGVAFVVLFYMVLAEGVSSVSMRDMVDWKREGWRLTLS